MTTTPMPPIVPPDDDGNEAVEGAVGPMSSADADRAASEGEPVDDRTAVDDVSGTSSADDDYEASMGESRHTDPDEGED